MLVLEPSPSPRLNASSENQIGNVSFHSSWNNKTHKFMQSRLEHKVTICCVLGTHTQTHAHRDKERKKESNTQIRAQSKGFHCPFTPDERVREHRIRPLEINEDVFAAFVYSMQTSCRLRGFFDCQSVVCIRNRFRILSFTGHKHMAGQSVCPGFQLLTTLDSRSSSSASAH